MTCRPRLRNGDRLCGRGNSAGRKPLVQTTGLRHVLIPVRACLGRALLGFKVNVEEAITLVVAIGPGELILQAPQEVTAHVDTHLHGLEQPAQVLLDVVDARLVVHKTVLVGVLVAHAVFGNEDLLVVGVALLDVDEQVEQALGIDDPVPVGGGDAGLVHVLANT